MSSTSFNVLCYIEMKVARTDKDTGYDDESWEDTQFVTMLAIDKQPGEIMTYLRTVPGIDEFDLENAADQMKIYKESIEGEEDEATEE